MRVAYLCADPGVPVFGTKGASVHVQEIVRSFRARGDEVTIYCTRRGDDVPGDLAGVRIVERKVQARTPAARERAVAEAARELAAHAASDGCDLVYERFALFSTAAADVARCSAAASVVEVNAPLIDEQRAHRTLVDEDAALSAAADVLGAAGVAACVSAPVAAWAAAHGAPRVVVAANGVNTDRIRPPAERSDQRPLQVGFVGTLKPWHGVDVLIEAMSLLTRDVPATLVVVGDGPEGASLRALARERGVDARFLGAVAPAGIPGVLARLDVGVAPYPADADAYFSPLKVYEYLAAGLPVVASRVGQIPEVVADGVTGMLVAPGSPPALAGALAALRDAPGERRRMGRAARTAAVERHDWGRVLRRILGALSAGEARR